MWYTTRENIFQKKGGIIMFNLDPSKMAEKLGGEAGEAAKNVLQGVKKMADAPGQAPEQVVAVLRKLLAEAKQLAPVQKNEALDACIQKAQSLLDGGNISTEAVTKLTAELGALLKNAPGAAAQQPAKGGAPANPAKAPAAAQRTAPPQSASEPAKGKPVQFSDVDAGAYYYDAVQWAVQQGIASGTSETTFGPDQKCTRGQTITMLWKSAGSPAPKNQNNPFTDVKESAYYYKPVLWAAERGIATGTSFEPDAAITRGQFATFLYRNAGSPAAAANHSFTDVPSDAYYSQAVAWISAKGIASGTGEHTFSPDGVCTRGQIVTMLHRAKK